ncbi:MAG: glycosyl transferase family 28 [Chitinophagaceae bacterium]|nr:glycosyl transferase family 28 [Chitinophagaceae bacterium]
MTNGKNFNNPPAKAKILIAPLEWGLGHATRCIPIINELINQNCEVLIAAEGAAFSLLKQEFPRLTFLSLQGYRMKYSRKKYFLPLKILAQLPKIAFTVYKEHQWLKEKVKEYKIDAVISDNRFGMYHAKIPSIYITHQLLIKTGNTFTERIAKRIHYFFINKYNQCWVPDFASGGEANGLAGELSHPQKLPKKIKYIGALSRFKPDVSVKKYDLLVSISGPEPQRTIFEDKILSGLKSYPGKALFIRGLPEESEELKGENQLEIRNHLTAKQLNEAIQQSGIIISRCGYTTIMDLVKLHKKAILIPTPGQTEQEYLAKYLMERKIFYTVNQKDFVLQNSLQQADSFAFSIPEFNMEQYKNIIDQFVQLL